MAIALDSRSYVIEMPARRTGTAESMQAVYLRRRLVVAMAALSVVLAACLGLRAVANHGSDTASVSVVTPVAATGCVRPQPGCVRGPAGRHHVVHRLVADQRKRARLRASAHSAQRQRVARRGPASGSARRLTSCTPD